MGWVEHRIGESHKATQHFRRALELNPNSDGAMAGLGLQVVRSDPEEALRLFTRSHEIDPTGTFSYRQKHFALMMLGRTEEAIRQLELGIEADPSEGVFYNDLSDLLIGVQGRPDEAARQVSGLLQLAPRSFTGVTAMVEAWIEAGDESRASRWVEQLMKERDDSDEAKRLNARRLHTFARFDEALGQLDEVQVNDDTALNMMLRRLTANLGLGDKDAIAENQEAYTNLLNANKEKGVISPFFAVLGTIVDVLAREAAEPGYDPTTTLNSLPPLENVPRLQYAYFLQAGVQARLGNRGRAMDFLEQSLQKPDGGVFNTDALRFSVEQSPLLDPLRDEPAFQDWLQRYRLRRDTMLERMIEMENRGEIISTATVNRITET
jgi:tetratricopeptide (TPR) repeat protein